MKCIVVFILVLTALSARAETPEQFFEQANRAYQQGKFVDAIRMYEQILHGNIFGGELFYNLGNAYYKSGNIGKAILNYERALKLMPNDDDLRHNLQLANLLITDKIEPGPRLFVWDWWDNIKSSFSLNGITWFCCFFFALMICAATFMVLTRSYGMRRFGFFSAVLSGLLLISSLVIFTGKLNAVQSANTAIVLTNITTVKNSPDAKSTDAFVLHNGVKVFITDKVNDWIKIRLVDGKVGWMEQRAAEII